MRWPIIIAGHPGNDLVSLWGHCYCVPSVPKAIDLAAPDSGVLLLADYPGHPVLLDTDTLAVARRKRLRLFIEFPRQVGDHGSEKIRQVTRRERAIVSSDWFGSELPNLSILATHDCHYLELPAGSVHVVLAVAAGYDTAVFGLPEQTTPLLVQIDEQILVAGTSFSHCINARYGPHAAWQHIWRRILSWVSRGEVNEMPTWQPSVYPGFRREDALPDDAIRQALTRAVDWHYRSRLLVHPSREEFHLRQDQEGMYPVACDVPVGDGRNGLAEGFWSCVRHDGSQLQRIGRRSDNQSETALAMALAWRVSGRDADRQLSENLLDYLYIHSNLTHGAMDNPEHPSYGLTAWSENSGDNRYYLGGDNRQHLSSVAASVLLDDHRWDEAILRTMVAAERIVGPNGFCHRPSTRELEQFGWRYFAEKDSDGEDWTCNDSPAASFLMAYALTGYTPFYAKGKGFIEVMMRLYPDGLAWWNTCNSAMSVGLLALSWLVRLDDTPRHRRWLRRVVDDLLALQQPCGAIREDVGGPGRGEVVGYGPCHSNDDFATRESVLIQRNGDPAADLLYCNNFAAVNLHEAYCALGDTDIRDARDRLLAFLCRTQIRSERFPELDGAWYRTFDYAKWEYFGNSSDLGWGSWSIETGWTMSWIIMGLSLRLLDASLWDICRQSTLARHLPVILAAMARNDGSPWSGQSMHETVRPDRGLANFTGEA